MSSDLMATDPRLEALRLYADARQAYESSRDETSELKKAYDESQQLLVEAIMASGAKDTGKLPGVGEATMLPPALKVDVLAGDRARLATWIREIGKGDNLFETLLPSALKEAVELQIESGKTLPDFVKTYYEPRLQFRKGV